MKQSIKNVINEHLLPALSTAKMLHSYAIKQGKENDIKVTKQEIEDIQEVISILKEKLTI